MIDRHAREGIVTNQPDGYDSTQPHASVAVCDRPECIRKAMRWVASETNQTAVHVTDAERRAHRASA